MEHLGQSCRHFVLDRIPATVNWRLTLLCGENCDHLCQSNCLLFHAANNGVTLSVRTILLFWLLHFLKIEEDQLGWLKIENICTYYHNFYFSINLTTAILVLECYKMRVELFYGLFWNLISWISQVTEFDKQIIV